MARSGKVRKIGTVKFNDLVPQVSWDVAGAIAAALNARRNVHETYDPEFVSPQGAKLAAQATNPELAIVLVDPKKLKACASEVVEQEEIPKYVEAWKGGARFPPVVVNSRHVADKMLHEGWHRSCSAARAEIPEIEAIDVAGVDVEALDRWIRSKEE